MEFLTAEGNLFVVWRFVHLLKRATFSRGRTDFLQSALLHCSHRTANNEEGSL